MANVTNVDEALDGELAAFGSCLGSIVEAVPGTSVITQDRPLMILLKNGH